MTNLDVLYHEIMAKPEIGELICADGQNPRRRPLIDKNQVELVIRANPNIEGDTPGLMATYDGALYEISLCEYCYEAIIIALLNGKS